MAAQTPFRITPSLGPDLWQHSPAYYWDTVTEPDGDPPSYQLGSVVRGNDGYEYIFVEAAGALAADDGVSINTTTWVATADGTTPVAEAPVAVAAGDFFHARRISDLFA